MDIKKHFKKKDWVYYLTVFVAYSVAFALVTKLFPGYTWTYTLISGVIGGVVFTLLTALTNHTHKDIKAAVEEDKRMGITKEKNN